MKNVETTTRSLLEPLSKINFLDFSLSSLVGMKHPRGSTRNWRSSIMSDGRKFIRDLMPLVNSDAGSSEEVKVYSILGAGTGGTIDMDDLGLKKGYTALKAALSSTMYADLMMQVSGYISHMPLPISAGDSQNQQSNSQRTTPRSSSLMPFPASCVLQ
jgi:hypothetical protein